MRFVAVDVETANADRASICQVGIAEFGPEGLSRQWKSVIDPEDYFDPLNVSIHGIDSDSVRTAPRLPDVAPDLFRLMHGEIVVHHTAFDRVAVQRAFLRYGLDLPQVHWLDSARVARRTWEQVAERGYGLSSLAAKLGIPLRHHDALSDAIAAGEIVRRAVVESGRSVEEWLVEAVASPSRRIQSGDPLGHLRGERIVFTGALTMPRREATGLAVAAGADVASSVSKKVTVVVVGLQDVRRTNGRGKSAKHLKAEGLIESGVPIRIIGEEDFLHLVGAD